MGSATTTQLQDTQEQEFLEKENRRDGEEEISETKNSALLIIQTFPLVQMKITEAKWRESKGKQLG